MSDAHSAKIRVMLDAVFNHCGTEFFAWKDVCAKGKNSPYYDWFFINREDFVKDSFHTTDARFYTFSFWAGMPKLNTNNPEVQQYFTDLCVHWARDFKIDGIRFDVGDEISHRFLKKLNNALKAVNPELFLLGEIWFDAIRWLDGTEYDAVMNYPFTGSVNDFWRDQSTDARAFMHRINFSRSLYPHQINEVNFNFLDTHDTPRVMETCSSEDVLLQKLTVLFTAAGSPCIYYGTELAMRGKHTPFNRSTMPWDEIESGQYADFQAKVAALIHTRNTLAPLKNDSLEFVFDSEHPRLVCFRKENITVYINAGDSAVQISDGNIEFANRCENHTLYPNGVCIVSG